MFKLEREIGKISLIFLAALARVERFEPRIPYQEAIRLDPPTSRLRPSNPGPDERLVFEWPLIIQPQRPEETWVAAILWASQHHRLRRLVTKTPCSSLPSSGVSKTAVKSTKGRSTTLQEEVIVAHRFIEELALEDQGSIRAAVGI